MLAPGRYHPPHEQARLDRARRPRTPGRGVTVAGGAGPVSPGAGWPLTPVGVVRSGFGERFGTPRQPGLVPAATAELHLAAPYDAPEALRGLGACTHVWLLFGFHAVVDRGWTPTVRPPRLGGNRRLGVFATRSPFRPNGLGLSVVRLLDLLRPPGPCGLRLAGVDLLDGTPVFDIKPYLPYADAPPDAATPAEFAAPPERLAVRYSAAARCTLGAADAGIEALITQTLSLDPRPAYRRSQRHRVHGTRLAGYDVHWEVDGDGVRVREIVKVE